MLHILATGFHAAAVIHHLCVCYHSNQSKNPSEGLHEAVIDMYNFELKYFTTWNMTFQTIYFLLALILDVLRYFPRVRTDRLLKINSYIFSSFVLPCSAFVSLMFWTLFFIDREFILPEVLDEFVPNWLNHSVHTSVVPLVLIEILLKDMPTPNFKSGFIGLTVLSLIYNCVYFLTYYETGRWIYPLFYVLNWYERISMVLFNYLASIVLFRIGLFVQQYKYKITSGCYTKKYQKYKDLIHSD